jgi:hypothetical protein
MAATISEGDLTDAIAIRPRAEDDQKKSTDAESIEIRNEREVLEHPEQVTQDAQIGIQKAEATALVWSKTALYSTYAW